MFPEDVLDEVVKAIDGGHVKAVGDDFELWAGPTRLFTVHSPATGWPVTVKQWDGRGGFCGWASAADGYNPNEARVKSLSADPVQARRELEVMERQSKENPIDTPEELKSLLSKLMESSDTKTLLAAAKAISVRKASRAK